ncbi:hypothetical protein BTM_6123 (plasmid) [Burkholderia thailandensis 34]|uniref:PelD GGDEF domain-containing protein n=1 Tax=Burkholderia thailandensis TaxID=57975 RepID=UPI0005F23D7D|nr:PelD GGDEF domain-containing protein [Burkholderia thailandensis]AJY27245.1 hypothetical protein BTM_6123 [Burkholderia thailandensis 34]AOJ58513.1 hypothetical protein AQ477_17920 [Burkholderia thailandensis]KXF59789.1 hypothetical protein AQ476_18400 [Burkholderia thailandensis]PNE73162.1 hypothetical protein A8H37_13685 [Burkholderia thailandensis]
MNTASPSVGEQALTTRHSYPLGGVGRLRRLLVPAVTRPSAVVETVLMIVIANGAGYWLRPSDPQLVHTEFPWMWLVVLLASLRYGTLLGLLAGCLSMVAWVVHSPASGEFPIQYFAGGLIMTIIAGHFGDTWSSRITRAAARNDYLNDRLIALTHSHYLLRLSHDRLEMDLFSKPATLRESISALRELAAHASDADQTGSSGELSGAAELLDYVARSCQIEVAAFYPVRGGKVSGVALAQIGNAFELDVGDVLIRQAIDTLGIAHLKIGDAVVLDSQYIACAPAMSADGVLRAILVVKRMPFLALNFDNLQFLLVLLCYYADGVEHSALVSDMVRVLPGCPMEFAQEFGRLARLQRQAGVTSSVVVLTFPCTEAGEELIEFVTRRRRSLDVAWRIQTGAREFLVNLMPDTDAAGVEGYLARIEHELGSQFSTTLENAGVGVHSLHLEGGASAASLHHLLQRSGLND